MMIMAKHRLEKLADDLAAPFDRSYWLNLRKPYHGFVDSVKKNTLYPTLLRCPEEILAMDESSKALSN